MRAYLIPTWLQEYEEENGMTITPQGIIKLKTSSRRKRFLEDELSQCLKSMAESVDTIRLLTLEIINESNEKEV